MYRLQRVGLSSRRQFLQLLQSSEAPPPPDADAATLRAALDAALAELSQVDCAVTAYDHERIAQRALAALPSARGARALCLPDTNLEGPAARAPGFRARADESHISVIVSAPLHGQALHEQVQAECIAAVRHALEPRRLLTSQLHVVAPQWLYVRLRLWVDARPGADRASLAHHIAHALAAWQAKPGAARNALDLADIADHIAALNDVEGVARAAFVGASMHPASLGTDAAAIGIQIGLHSTIGEDTRLGCNPPITAERLLRDRGGELTALVLEPWEVARLELRPGDIHWLDEATGEEVRR
jgi:hypothetical protein